MKTEFNENENENQSQRETLMSRDFKGVWTPREIWLNKGLSIWAKNLWAEIHSLFNRKKGGCYASDEYLCEFLNLKKSRLHEVLKELRDAHLLEKISFDGRERLLKAIVPETDYGPDKEPSVEGSLPGSRNPAIQDPGNDPLYRAKSLSKDKERGAKPPPPSTRSKKVKRREHVATTDEEHAKLLDKIGPEKTEACYQRLSEWKEDTPKSKWKKDDYRAVLRWVIDAVDEQEKKEGKENIPHNNRAYAEKIAENYNLNVGPRKQVRLTVRGDRLEILSTCPTANLPPTSIRFQEKGFVDQVDNALRKWRLK